MNFDFLETSKSFPIIISRNVHWGQRTVTHTEIDRRLRSVQRTRNNTHTKRKSRVYTNLGTRLYWLQLIFPSHLIALYYEWVKTNAGCLTMYQDWPITLYL